MIDVQNFLKNTFERTQHALFIDTDSAIFWIGLNVAIFFSLCLGLYFTRRSPNYFWLFAGLLIIKLVDVSLLPWLRNQGIWLYAWYIFGDGLVLLLIARRNQFVYWLSSNSWLKKIRQWALSSQAHQKMSYQDICLIVIYSISIVVSLLIVGEYLINQHLGEVVSRLIYDHSSMVKVTLNIIELVLLFNIATGNAILYSRRNRATAVNP